MANTTRGHSSELIGHIRAFNKHRFLIDEVYYNLRGSGEVEEIPKVDLIEIGRDKFDPSMRQMVLKYDSVVLGEGDTANLFVSGLDQLYEVAAEAAKIFTTLLKSDLASVLVASSIFPDIARRIHLAPLKGRDRAAEKARDDYSSRADGPGEAWLYDIVRGSIECDTQDQICAIVAALRELHPRVQIVRLKNRFKNPTPSGFRDVNMNLRIEVGGTGVFHLCELQIHLKAIYDFNYENHSHHHYEVWYEVCVSVCWCVWLI